MGQYFKTFEEFTNKKIKKQLSKVTHFTSHEQNIAEQEARIQQQQEITQRGVANLNIEKKV